MIPIIFGIGSALITIVGVHFGAGEIDRGHKAAWIGASAAGAISGAIGIVLAIFPGLWVNIFTESEAVRQACNTYLQIVGPFFGIFGFGLCLFFASQGARRMFWPVMIGMVRLIVISVGGALVVWLTEPTEELLFGLIALAMLLYGIGITGAIKLGAWR
jgi:Na+-driven multidrug efflux pump